MKTIPRFSRILAASLVLLAAETAGGQATSDATSGTQILKWKDGAIACFVLAFDDGAPSQLTNVVPELQKRKIVGTFYLVTGNSLYASLKGKWEEAIKSPYIVVANHTFTHRGANNAEELGPELDKCNEVLHALYPDRKQPRLLAFGKPGGVPWVISDEELSATLEKRYLINRPPFAGPPIHYKSAAAMIAVVDKALSQGGMGHLDFHGVGGDWLVTPLDWFTALLDKLESSREQLWVTDTVSVHQYEKERQAAEVKTLETSKDRIRIELACKLDPALYDLPLTLSTKVPASWKNCLVVQGPNKATVPVRDGVVQYSATPSAGEISIRPGDGS